MKLITCKRTPTVTARALGHFLSLGIMATTFPKMVFSFPTKHFKIQMLSQILRFSYKEGISAN